MAMAVDQKLLRQTKFPPEFNRKVDLSKVNVEVMKKWIARKLSDLLGTDDDVVTELCYNLLQGTKYPDIKALQIQLTGFLDKDTPKFCKELWNLCLSAQDSPNGIPQELLEAKKQELMQEKIETQKAIEAAQRQREDNANRQNNLESIRQRERGDRAERGRGRGSRDHRDFEPRRHPYARSPPARRRSPYGSSLRRDVDTYKPSISRPMSPRSRQSRKRSESVSARSQSPESDGKAPKRSRSRSRSPPRKQRRLTPDDVEKDARPPRKARSRSSSRSSHERVREPPSRHHRSRSRSPPTRSRREYRRRRSPSTSASETDEDNTRNGRRRRSPSYTRYSRKEERADVVRSRKPRDDARLSRSPDDSNRKRRRRERSDSGSRSSSPDRGHRRHHKRRRSLRRYEPRARRRNTSSASSSPPPRAVPDLDVSVAPLKDVDTGEK